ncbi:MAG: hypothetical protein ACFCGT_18000 [Sandaracinaceae bacterium]
MDLVQQLQAKWKAEGKAEGRAEGVLDGRRETLRKQLALKFGALPEDAGKRVANATAEELDRWTERVLVASSLDDVLEGWARGTPPLRADILHTARACQASLRATTWASSGLSRSSSILSPVEAHLRLAGGGHGGRVSCEAGVNVDRYLQ